MTVYLDNCCYNRPFDDQTQERIHLESEVILTILQRGQVGIYTIVGSDIVELEMDRMRDPMKKQKVKELYRAAKVIVNYTERMKERSQEIMKKSRNSDF